MESKTLKFEQILKTDHFHYWPRIINITSDEINLSSHLFHL